MSESPRDKWIRYGFTEYPADFKPDPLRFEHLIGRGLFLVPCGWKREEKNGVVKYKKEPIPWLAPNGASDASNDPVVIRGWLDEVSVLLLGMHAGKNDLMFLDPDLRNQGVGNLAELEKKHGQLPKPLTSTPGGGSHYRFKAVEKVASSRNVVAPGIDVIARNAYVIAPGSIIPGYGTGAYELIRSLDDPADDAPDWLLNLMLNGGGGGAQGTGFDGYTPARVNQMFDKLGALHAWKDLNLQLAAAHAAAAWNPRVSHDHGMIIGSFLYSKAGWTDPDKISSFTVLIAKAVGKTGDSIEDVGRSSRAGWERGQKGNPNIAGFPKLRGLLGEEAATQFATLLGCQQRGSHKKEEEHYWRPHVITAADVEPTAVNWIWPGRLMRKKLCLCNGDTAVGKSLLISDIVARITKGRTAPLDDDWIMPKGDVLWFVTEDDPDDTLVPRLIAAGADLNRVHFIDSLVDEIGNHRGFDITQDLRLLEALLKEYPETVLVIFDPLQELLGKKSEQANVNAVIRGALGPFIEIAKRSNVGYLGVSHVAKQRQGSVRSSAIGSVAFSAMARAAWFIDDELADSEGERAPTGRKLLTVAKSNLAEPEDMETYAYSIETRIIPGKVNRGTENEFNIDIETAAVVWHEVVDISAQTVWAKTEKRKPGPAANKLEEAVVWLRSVLYSHNDLVSGQPVYRECRSKEVDALREATNISDSSYARAKKLLGVTSFSKEGEFWLSVAALNGSN